jgi:hypothetical protein
MKEHEIITHGNHTLSSTAGETGGAASLPHGTAGGISIDFHSAEFNRIDDLNDCSGNYRIFQPLDGVVTADMRHQMERLRKGDAFDAAVDDTEKEIIGCITGRCPPGDVIRRTRNIVGAIEKMNTKGVRIKYLLPKFPDRLYIGVQHAKAGAAIFFGRCLMARNIRYRIVDERSIVLGVPE